MSATFNLNNHVLALLEKMNHLKHLKQLQAFLITRGHSQTQFYAFKLVRFCNLTLLDLKYARYIFDHLFSPNIYLYTAMITAYASQPDHRSSFNLYRDMVRRAIPKPNHFIFPHVLRSCPVVLESYGTEMLHTQILKLGFGEYPVVQTALVDSYSRFCSDLGIARQLFDEMTERNVVTWTAMVSGYTRVGEMGNAVLLFEKMPERDAPSWNAVIAGCTQNGLFSEAISLFRRMVQSNKPNQVSVVCTLSACGHGGMLQLGKCIHGYICRNNLGSDYYISNALIDMYGKCGSLVEAKTIFDKTSQRNLTSWNSMINCLALHGQSDSAVSIFEEMIGHSDNVIPDSVTFVGLLNACTHGGLVDQGRTYFNMMINDYHIEPQIEHYGCLIDLLGRAGLFDEAYKVIEEMRIPPDEVVWGSLLNGCKIHGRMEMAEVAVKKLIGIDPNNGGYGIMLANIYSESGRWDEVRKMRKVLKELNVHKTPGCSWIEIDNQLHQFYSVDKTHPRTEDIYLTLECLANRL